MQKLTLLTTNMEVYRFPRQIPGYLGYTPTIKYTYGDTYGNTTAKRFADYRAHTLDTSRQEMFRGGHQHLPFPTFYTGKPEHILGTRTRARDRWEAAPKYQLYNAHDRDVKITHFDDAAQRHREQYRDSTETVKPVKLFLLPKISHDALPKLYSRDGKTLDERKAVAFANQFYRTMKPTSLAKSDIPSRQIRDVFFEKR